MSMRILSGVIVLLVIGLIFSCSKDDPDPLSFVRVIHASPDAPAVDLRLNSELVYSNITYKTGSDYITARPGPNNFSISPTGTTLGAITGSVDLVENAFYTVIAADSVNKIKGSITRDSRILPPAGKAYLRVFHLSGNAPGVEVLLNASPLYSGRIFFDHTTNAGFLSYAEINAGIQTLQVRQPGSSTILAGLTGVAFQEGKLYSACFIGFLGGVGQQALALTVYQDN